MKVLAHVGGSQIPFAGRTELDDNARVSSRQIRHRVLVRALPRFGAILFKVSEERGVGNEIRLRTGGSDQRLSLNIAVGLC